MNLFGCQLQFQVNPKSWQTKTITSSNSGWVFSAGFRSDATTNKSQWLGLLGCRTGQSFARFGYLGRNGEERLFLVTKDVEILLVWGNKNRWFATNNCIHICFCKAWMVGPGVFFVWSGWVDCVWMKCGGQISDAEFIWWLLTFLSPRIGHSCCNKSKNINNTTKPTLFGWKKGITLLFSRDHIPLLESWHNPTSTIGWHLAVFSFSRPNVAKKTRTKSPAANV